MKTDRFSDSIRRKLESIRPDFSEKDWARMQATLQQATPPPSAGSPTAHQPFTGSTWLAQPWLMAAAAVSTVVLISIAVWQRSQIAELRQTVSQLTQSKTTQTPITRPGSPTVDALPFPGNQSASNRTESPAESIEQSASRKRDITSRSDTVFVTRYVAIPARSPQTDVSEQSRDGGSLPVADQTRSLAERQLQQEKFTRTPRTGQENGTTTESPEKDNLATESIEEKSFPDKTEPISTEAVKMPAAMGRSTNGTVNRLATESRATRQLNEKTGKPFKREQMNDVARRREQPSVAGSNLTSPTGSRPETVPGRSSEEAVVEPSTTVAKTYELTASRPVTMGHVDWNRALAYRAKRMRPVRTTVVGGTVPTATAEPESQPANRVAFGFRLGAGVDVTKTVLGGDVRGELLIGDHFTLGAGLGTATFEGGTFRNDIEFNYNTKRDFRREFAPSLDPRKPFKFIKDIDTRTERVQVPLTLGYRIPIGKTLSVLPSIGTTLYFKTRETVTFYNFDPFFGSKKHTMLITRPVDLLNNVTLGAGIEWHNRHWVAQAGPLLTVAATPDPHWQQGTSTGLRARLFYQF